MTEDVATYDTGTPVSTPQLDPEAVEAAAKHLYNNDPEGMNALGFGDPWETFAPTNDIPAPYYRHLVATAITAYMQAIEPKLRERVIAYNDTTWDCVVAQERGMAQAEVTKRYEAFQDADTALYALFGLEAE